MQLLEVLPHYKDMTVQLSMTGATILRETKFKARHGGTKIIVQRPDLGLILKKNDTTTIKEITKRKKVKKIDPNNEIIQVEKVKIIKYYSVNKTQVSHRIRNFVNQMTSERKLYFWTITFPAGTSDDTAFICFNKWLTRVRKELNLNSYLWITERQDGKKLEDQSKTATQTIHFHIAIHQRMCVQKANRYMRACLFTCIDKGEIEYSRQQAKSYNGVDIAKDRKTKRVINFAKNDKQKALTNYLTKYLSKSNQSFQHLAWHCSRDYSNLITSIRITMDEFIKTTYETLLPIKPTINSEWFEFYGWSTGPPVKLLQYLSFVNQKAQLLLN